MLSYLGVVFSDYQIIITLFMISILLMFLGTKYVCFSYSGGIISVISVTIQFCEKYLNMDLSQLDFLKVDVLMLVSLVAVLHIVEGILVMIDGSKGSIPVFTNRDNRIIGGFVFKRYWALPIVTLFLMQQSNLASGTNIATPNWWPLIRSNSYGLISTAIIGMSAFYGMLGYNSITFTKTKKQKVLISGLSISTYGLVMLLIAEAAKVNLLQPYWLEFLCPLLMK